MYVQLVNGQSSTQIAEHTLMSIKDIDSLPSASCDDLVLLDNIIGDFSLEDLQLLASKIRHEGILKIHGYDIDEVARGIMMGNFTMEEIQPILSNKKGIHSLFNFRMFFSNLGWKILLQKMNDYQFYFETQRP